MENKNEKSKNNKKNRLRCSLNWMYRGQSQKGAREKRGRKRTVKWLVSA